MQALQFEEILHLFYLSFRTEGRKMGSVKTRLRFFSHLNRVEIWPKNSAVQQIIVLFSQNVI